MRQQIPLKEQKNSHIYAFDLLRVLSLFGVLLYHFWPRQAPLGLLGVVGFFVLAGYLCMLKAIRRPADRGIGENLLRRAEKIYPPLVFMLIVLSLLMIFLFPEFLPNFAGQMRSSLLGGNNLYQIFKAESYFEGAGYLKPLTHLWALSLEMQFYLFFYLLVYRFYSSRNRDLWLIIFLLLSLASLLLLNLLYEPGTDPSRLYYGLDTRFSAFGLGLAAAIIRHDYLGEVLAKKKRAVESTEIEKDILQKIQQGLVQFALLCFTLLLFVLYFFDFPLDWTLRFGLFVYALGFALLMACSADSRNWLAKIGRNPFISYLAKQSYLLYLWHYPTLRISERLLAFVDLPSWSYPLIALTLSLILAELCRNLAKLANLLWQKRSFTIALACGLVLLAIPWQIVYTLSGGEALVLMQEKIEEQERLMEQDREARMAELQRQREAARIRAEEERKKASQTTVNESKARLKGPGGWELKTQLNLPRIPTLTSEQKAYLDNGLIATMRDFAKLPEPGFKINLDDYWRYRHIPISMIGDSVSVISSYHIEPYLPFLYLDALSNRQMGQLWEVYSELKSYDLIGEMLIVALSTNGDVVPEELEKVWKDLDGKPMIIVTIALPYQGQEEYRNNDLRNFAKKHEQVWLVEWDKNSKNHPEFFMEDLIHPSDPLGCQAYCHLLAAKITEICRAHEDSGLLEITNLENIKPLPPAFQESPSLTEPLPSESSPETAQGETPDEESGDEQPGEEEQADGAQPAADSWQAEEGPPEASVESPGAGLE